MESAYSAESKMIAAMSQQKNVNKPQIKMASYFDGTPVGLLDANFEEVRKSNSPGFKKKNSGLYGKYI